MGAATGIAISDYDAFRAAVGKRLDVFGAAGCRLSDHGLDDCAYVSMTEADTAALFARCLGGDALSGADALRLRSGILRFLGADYARRGWIMQLHLGAQRRQRRCIRR